MITLTSETWDPTVGQDNAITTALINGIDSDSSEATGWDAVVKANMDFNDVTRTSDTVVTITLGPEPTYAVTSDETITVTIPASALSGSDPIVATPTFDIRVGTYYVRTDGSDANSGGSNTAGGAWLTIQKAAATMLAGDTVLVQPGTYGETVTPANHGTVGNPITYQAAGAVVIDGNNIRCQALDVSGTDYLTFDGFEVTDQPDCGNSAIKIDNSDNIVIRNNVIHDTGRDAVNFYGTSSNGLVENNLIYDIDDDGSTPTGGGNHTYRANTFAGTIGGWTLEGGNASNLFEDNIFWAAAIQNTALGTFNYNDYNSAVLPGTGNISSDPLFVNAAGADFHLSQIAAGQGSDSPAVDVGSDTAANLGFSDRSTRTDQVADAGTMDLGFHYE